MIRKSFLALVVFATALVMLPAIASAHVEIEADGKPAADGNIKTTVSAENECANDGKLTNVQLVFPESPSLTVATAETVDGWTATVAKRAGSDAIETVTWVNSGQVDGNGTFPITLGAIPSGTKEVDFKALDTCEDGEVTRWVEPGENSEHPAPVLAISTSSSHSSGTTTTTKAADSKSDDSNTGLIVGIIAAVVVVGGGAAFLLSRRRKTTT
jgi:uncharacterized protein YcnI